MLSTLWRVSNCSVATNSRHCASLTRFLSREIFALSVPTVALVQGAVRQLKSASGAVTVASVRDNSCSFYVNAAIR